MRTLMPLHGPALARYWSARTGQSRRQSSGRPEATRRQRLRIDWLAKSASSRNYFYN